MSATTDRVALAAPRLPAFSDVLCAVDGSRGSAAAIRRAIELAQPTGRMTFLSVTDARGTGPNRIAGMGEHRATSALALAKHLAGEQGMGCEVELVHGAFPVEEILARQPDHELLVVGGHPIPRAAGVMIGDTATTLAHRTTGALLLARPSLSPEPFPQRIIVATAAERADDPVIDMAIRVALARGAHLGVVHATPSGVLARGPRPLSSIAADVWIRTGCEPILTEEPGDPATLVAQVVERDRAGLLVVGHGGRTGIHALGSVSERLVQRAACSVLLVPVEDAR